LTQYRDSTGPHAKMALMWQVSHEANTAMSCSNSAMKQALLLICIHSAMKQAMLLSAC